MFYRGLTCAAAEEPLLDGTSPIPNTYFTASTQNPEWEAYRARMSNAVNCWSPTNVELAANPPTCYLQVDEEHVSLYFLITYNDRQCTPTSNLVYCFMRVYKVFSLYLNKQNV